MKRPDPVLVFGANGYTAGLILEVATAAGLRPILSARNPDRLAAVAAKHGLEQRAAGLDDPSALRRALSGVRLVLNAAGPFAQTALPMLQACIEARAHYLDISGEVAALEAVAERHAAARAAGICVLPGVGFDVVPSDCLCAHVLRRSPGARKLRIAVSGLELLSPGSVRALSAELGKPTLVRRGGALCAIEPGSLTRAFDFGAGPRPCMAVSWGDLSTAYYSTGIADIETYFEITPAILAMSQANRSFGWLYRLPWVRQAIEAPLPLYLSAPSAEQRARKGARLVVEAEDGRGRCVRSLMTTPEAYTLTAQTATAIVTRVLRGDAEPGFQTPARLFGPGFILGFAGVSRADLETDT